MKSLISFWKKDLINKLIVLVLLLILVGGVGFIYMLFNLPGGRTPLAIISGLFPSPTPTVDVNGAFTSMAQTAIIEQTPAYLRGPATITPASSSRTHSTSSPATPVATSQYSSTPGPTSTATPTPTLAALEISGLKCIPNNPGQTGRVLDILDGVSARIMIDGLVYVVRYIGVDLPVESAFYDTASMLNGQLTWGKDVLLYPDLIDKDELGQLLRYVVIDEKLVDLELINKGLATVADIPSGFNCASAFHDAEKIARATYLGLWYKKP